MPYYYTNIIGCFLLLFILTQNAFAQIDTVYICNPGDPIQLNAASGLFGYEWLPNTGLSNPNIHNPIARPDSHTTYIVKMLPALIDQNLIINPGFEEGNTGFTSDYPYATTINTQGVYGINQSAANLNPVYFSDCPDHTTGNSNMMVIDGSPAPNEKVWCQSISVMPSTPYAFSTWLTSVNPNNPARLQFFINDSLIGNIFTASNNVCQWRQFYEIWDSGNAQEAEICIVNQNTNPNGNDFALDDFGFFELEPFRFDTVVVIVEALEAAKEQKVYFPNAFSPNFDGINDVFTPYLGKGAISVLDFKIFNRWGSLVFEKKDCAPAQDECGWDGTFLNQYLNPDIYVYFATILFADQRIKQFSGEVWLTR